MAEIRLDELLWSDKALIEVAKRGLTPSEVYDAIILDPVNKFDGIWAVRTAWGID